MLHRVFEEAVLQGTCGGKPKVAAFIPGGPLAREILQRLGGGNAIGPRIDKARARPHQEHFDLHPEDPGVEPQ